CGSGVDHRPGTVGTSVGRRLPSTCVTGAEKVSVIGASGLVRTFGPGEASTTGRLALGNHVTRTGSPSVSHGRAAAAIVTDPAAPRVGNETACPATVAPAT